MILLGERPAGKSPYCAPVCTQVWWWGTLAALGEVVCAPAADEQRGFLTAREAMATLCLWHPVCAGVSCAVHPCITIQQQARGTHSVLHFWRGSCSLWHAWGVEAMTMHASQLSQATPFPTGCHMHTVTSRRPDTALQMVPQHPSPSLGTAGRGCHALMSAGVGRHYPDLRKLRKRRLTSPDTSSCAIHSDSLPRGSSMLTCTGCAPACKRARAALRAGYRSGGKAEKAKDARCTYSVDHSQCAASCCGAAAHQVAGREQRAIAAASCLKHACCNFWITLLARAHETEHLYTTNAAPIC